MDQYPWLAKLHRLCVAEGIPMRLKVIEGTLSVRPQSLAFRCENGMQTVSGSISAETLRDMTDFHQVKGSPEEGFRALLPEIERLLNAKLQARRIDANGELAIRAADLLRFGFQARDKAAA
jgi:hypothetical protein